MNSSRQQALWEVAADTGGTFTDVVARGPDGTRREAKVLSSGILRLRCEPMEDGESARIIESGLPDGCLNGVTFGEGSRIEEHSGGVVRFGGFPFSGFPVLEIATGLPAPILGAHWVTQTPLLSPLPPLFLRIATTRGTNALLEGKGASVTLFVTHGFEDLLKIGNQTRPDLFERPIPSRPSLVTQSAGISIRLDRAGRVVEGDGPLELSDLAVSQHVGQPSVAVLSICNGYLDPEVETEWAQKLKESGWERVVTATSVSSQPSYLARTGTAVVEGYLGPILEEYLESISKAAGVRKVDVMTSAGGVLPRERFRAVDSLLSGPAGGVVGAVEAARSVGINSFLAFDMGGTSTDVSRFDGDVAYRSELSVGKAKIVAEALRIDTVAAGGGSICGFDGFGLTVGPGSAGADPGPACYGCGGPLTLTDVHLLLGRIDAERFRVPVDRGAAERAFEEVLQSIGREGSEAKEGEEILLGFLAIANERMAAALRGISIRDGLDPANFSLLSFGGAGGLHGCALAEAMGIERILQPGSAGILSAEGLSRATPEHIERKSILLPLDSFSAESETYFAPMEEQARGVLGEVLEDALEWKREVFIRLMGQESSITCEWGPGVDLVENFHQQFERIFGFRQQGLPLEVAAIRLRCRLRQEAPIMEEFPGGNRVQPGEDGFLWGENLPANAEGNGPCVISQEFGTLVVEAGWSFRLGERGSIILQRTAENEGPKISRSAPEEIQHELFRHRFSGIVESMGEMLRRTALSVNIREREDFSCALLDQEGRLVVNAPHIPVHLGALGHCVRSVSKVLDWREGDVAVTNHPGFGGSHLPDMTAIAPIFDRQNQRVAFLAVRAHHAEIGGIRPGSMPADARSLAEEGVVLSPFHLFRKGENRMDRFRDMLEAKSEHGHPSRNPAVNEADLLSQVAALHEGQSLLQALLNDVGTETVTCYLDRILSQAEVWMMEAFEALSAEWVENSVTTQLDGGEVIRVSCKRIPGGRVCINFAGTDKGSGSFQCPEGVTLSAVLYVCRLLAGRDMPLNEGLLRAVDLKIPSGCLLSAAFDDPDPSQQPPVVAGNVEVSQRAVEALIRLFGIEADSQGTMNNVIFGNDQFSHYETLAGGGGAGPSYKGATAVQVHMTNTAITDAEILEHRFPVRVNEFSIRSGSGGGGEFPGGDGVVREYLFEEDVELSLLTQHRKDGPQGMNGGQSGEPGRQFLILPDGSEENLPFACTVSVKAGTRLIVETPGGGGFG